MKSAIVTGANGFMGHHLVRTLVDNDYRVYAIVRSENSEVSCIAQMQNVKLIYCDMKNWDSLSKKLSGVQVDYVYHLAWAGSSGELRRDYKLQMDNVLCTCKLIEVMHLMHIKRLVVAGSVTQLMYREYLTEDDIAPEMVTCYAIGKMSTEYLCKCLCTEYGIDLCWTYVSNFYGADDTTNNFINFLMKSYSQGEVPKLTNAEQLADFAYVTDIARAMMYACEKGKKNTSYYVGYGQPRPLKEFIIELKNIVNEHIESGIGLKDFKGRNVDFNKIDVKKLTRDTGYHPQISFAEGIRLCCNTDLDGRK